MLDEGENVALALAARVPPAATTMGDDQDLAGAAAVFEAAARALGAVKPPHRRQLLQQRGAAHALLQPFNLCVLHGSAFLSGSAGQGGTALRLPFFLSSTVPSGRPRSRRGTRACAARERTARRTLVARAAQAVALSPCRPGSRWSSKVMGSPQRCGGHSHHDCCENLATHEEGGFNLAFGWINSREIPSTNIAAS